jgi:hypothetical protein
MTCPWCMGTMLEESFDALPRAWPDVPFLPHCLTPHLVIHSALVQALPLS